MIIWDGVVICGTAFFQVATNIHTTPSGGVVSHISKSLTLSRCTMAEWYQW